jgi:hypothetical protein
MPLLLLAFVCQFPREARGVHDLIEGISIEGHVSVLCYLRSNILNGSSRVGIAFNGKMLRAFLSRQL